MTLKEFLQQPGNSEAKLAECLGVSQGTVNRYANNKRWPDREMIVRIKDVTAGLVDFADWFPSEAAE